jgi:GTP-binding protein
MKTQIAYPKVMLVGRTNVGKSTIFNRLSQQKRSIVFEREGVTRDYIQDLVVWDKKPFLLIDSGGLSFERNRDDIDQRVQKQVLDLLGQADLLLFVCDCKNGLTQADVHIANILRKSKKPVLLLLNKADNQNVSDEALPEFYTLGFKTILPVSGIHSIGIGALLDTIIANIPEPREIETQEPQYKVVIIGRPNVGKSSLMNLLIQHERSIISNVAGTTREAIKETVYCCNDLIELTDTAGVRRPRKIDDSLEQLMVQSSLMAIKEADIVLAMIDASEGKIADQELKLLFYAYEQKKMVIVLINKTDLLEEYTSQTLEQSLDEYEFILKKMPLIRISCLTKKNVNKIFNEIQRVWQRCQQSFDPIELDEIIVQELATRPLYHKKNALRVQRIEPVATQTPTFKLVVNYPEWFGSTELGCIENILRKHYDLSGCPISFRLVKGE